MSEPFVGRPTEHHAYRPVFQEQDICPACTLWPDRIVNWPCDVEREREKARAAIKALEDRLAAAPEVVVDERLGLPTRCTVKVGGVVIFSGVSDVVLLERQ